MEEILAQALSTKGKVKRSCLTPRTLERPYKRRAPVGVSLEAKALTIVLKMKVLGFSIWLKMLTASGR